MAKETTGRRCEDGAPDFATIIGVSALIASWRSSSPGSSELGFIQPVTGPFNPAATPS
jgi:hypothetical protein